MESRGSRRLRVLVVEDDAAIRDALCDCLDLAGHQALAVADGREGLEAAARLEPDVILLDLRMPVVNGAEFLRRFETLGLSSRVVVLTANPATSRPGRRFRW